MRLLSSSPTPYDRFTKDELEKSPEIEHVVIIGNYKEFLPLLISEMREESSDYLQDLICTKANQSAWIIYSRYSNAGDYWCEWDDADE